MGWLRLAGSLKLQVAFAKEPYKKALYSQREIKALYSFVHVFSERALYGVATINRLLKIIGLFCTCILRKSLVSSAKRPCVNQKVLSSRKDNMPCMLRKEKKPCIFFFCIFL